MFHSLRYVPAGRQEETDVKDSVIYLGDWQTSYLGSSARLILQEVEVTVQLHCLQRILEDLWCSCVRSATSDLQRHNSSPKT